MPIDLRAPAETLQVHHQRGRRARQRHLFRLGGRAVAAPRARESYTRILAQTLGAREAAQTLLQSDARLLVSPAGTGTVRRDVQRQAHGRVQFCADVAARAARHVRAERPRERAVHRTRAPRVVVAGEDFFLFVTDGLVAARRLGARATRVQTRVETRRLVASRLAVSRGASRQVSVRGAHQPEEKLVRVVLPLPPEMLRRVAPPAVQERGGHHGLGVAAVHGADEAVQLAGEAGKTAPRWLLFFGARGHRARMFIAAAQLAHVPVAQEEAAHRGRPQRRVQHRAHEARVPEIHHAAHAARDAQRVHASQVRRAHRDQLGVVDYFRSRNTIGL